MAPVKREASRSPSPHPSNSKAKSTPASKAKKPKLAPKPKADAGGLKEGRARLAAAVVARGVAAALADAHALAAETGLTAKQIQNQLSTGRHNLRSRLEEVAKMA